MRTLALRAALAVLAPAVLLSTGGVALAQPTSSRATAEDTRLLPYATPGQLVDIGARRINLVCSGSGGPTVVLMAGSSSWSFVWYLTQPEIAEQSACLRLRQSCLWIQRSGATATSHARRGERPACGTQVRGSTSALCSDMERSVKWMLLISFHGGRGFKRKQEFKRKQAAVAAAMCDG